MVQHPSRIIQIGLVFGLIGTVGLGTALRWVLAGHPLPLGEFVLVRHAHTHLGFYGVLFPLVWLVVPTLGPQKGSGLGLYMAATALAIAGFLHEGYGLPAIVGSTLVLAVWVWGALRFQRQQGKGRDWASALAPGVLLGAALVPLVAKEGPGPRAQELVRTFLGVLLLGVVVPAALKRLGVRRPMPWLWLGITFVGALSLGAMPQFGLHVALALAGALLLWVLWESPLAWDLRLAWSVAAIGLGVLGLGLVPLHHTTAVAGTHYLVLGPLLLSLWPSPIRRSLRLILLVLASTMSTAIVVGPRPMALQLAAWSGLALALAWGFQGVRLVWPPKTGRPEPEFMSPG